VRVATDEGVGAARFDSVMSTETQTESHSYPITRLERIAAAVSASPEGDDAAVLGTAIARAVGGDLLLLAIEPDLRLVIPGLDWRRMRQETEVMLGRTRTSFAPEARRTVDSDLSEARGIKRLVAEQHRQLLACGSSRHGRPGEVSIGRTTRQLLDQVQCSLAIAPRGLSAEGELRFRRIGVGFDGGPEARAALRVAAVIASGCGAQLVVRGVVDDRIPALGWPHLWIESMTESWHEVMDDEAASLRRMAEEAAGELPISATVQLKRDGSSASLLVFSEEVDLLVIGSRRWGPLARLLLGGTGEALVHGSRCPLLVVPRPRGDG
jgi:nucleotide-binding universal stress UspA family protein